SDEASSKEPADRIGVKGGEILGPEIADVARRRERDRGGISSEPDREIEIAVEETVDQPGNKRVAGANSIDDLNGVSRRVADLAARQQEVTGFLARRTGHRHERHAVASRNRFGEALGLFGKAEDRAGVARRRARLEEHQTETRPGHPADMARIDAMAARLAIDDPAERSFREPRHPGDLAAEPRQNAADIELAAADTSLEQTRLLQTLQAGRRQAQQRLAAGQEIIARRRRRF